MDAREILEKHFSFFDIPLDALRAAPRIAIAIAADKASSPQIKIAALDSLTKMKRSNDTLLSLAATKQHVVTHRTEPTNAETLLEKQRRLTALCVTALDRAGASGSRSDPSGHPDFIVLDSSGSDGEDLSEAEKIHGS